MFTNAHRQQHPKRKELKITEVKLADITPATKVLYK